ncbi:MAG TPA: acyl carrier protein [Gammaproteobacteria bacterium]|nr:acyl carrier protein [Gammaproteobacteria bacterium]
MAEAKAAVKEYISENFLMGQNDINLGDETSFLELGLLDSTGVIELVSFLEEEFGIQVEDDEITPENLDTLNRISSYIERKSA